MRLLPLLTQVSGEGGRAVGIDHIPELVEMTRTNIQTDNPDLLTNEVVHLIGK